MRQTRGMRLWPVIYPVLLYFAVCQILAVVQMMLPFTAGWDAVMRQGVDTLGGLLVLYASFLRGRGKARGSLWSGLDIPGCFAAVFMLCCGSFALNNLLALTDLLQRSSGYQFVEQSFYSSSLFWEIAVLCVLTPVTEELLYRRIVFCELRGWMGRWGAVVVSALLFGAMHMNAVQMIYASGLGLLLGILMECYGDVRPAMCGHIAANLLSVLRSELGIFTGFSAGSAGYWTVTVFSAGAALFAAGGLVFGLLKREDKSWKK